MGREGERKRNINVQLPLVCPLLETWPATQACVLTGSQTSDPLVHRLVLSPLSHTSQGHIQRFWSRRLDGTLNLHFNKMPRWLSLKGCPLAVIWFYFKILFILFLGKEQGREKERERNINVWLPLVCPLLETWPATQACALTGNRTGGPLVLRSAVNPLSYTSQGPFGCFL